MDDKNAARAVPETFIDEFFQQKSRLLRGQAMQIAMTCERILSPPQFSQHLSRERGAGVHHLLAGLDFARMRWSIEALLENLLFITTGEFRSCLRFGFVEFDPRILDPANPLHCLAEL